MVADTVFLMIGVVGVGGTEQTAHIFIVLRVLVLVAHNEADGTACRLSFKNTAEQFHLIRLLARGGDLALSWSTTVQLVLYEVHIYLYACGHPVDDTADGLSVTLAKCGQPKDVTKRIHGVGLMTMTASAAVFVVMLVSAVSAVTILTVVMVSATATTACQHLDGLVDFFLCSLAVLANLAFES